MWLHVMWYIRYDIIWRWGVKGGVVSARAVHVAFYIYDYPPPPYTILYPHHPAYELHNMKCFILPLTGSVDSSASATYFSSASGKIGSSIGLIAAGGGGKSKQKKSPKSTLLPDNVRITKTKPRPVTSVAPHPITPVYVKRKMKWGGGTLWSKFLSLKTQKKK